MSSQALLDLQKMYPNCEFLQKLVSKFHIFWEIYEACGKTWEPNCGSYLFDGKNYDYCQIMYEKQKSLHDKAKVSTRLLECGVYQGHSLFCMLLGNPFLDATLIDIDDKFSVPAIRVLEKHFPQAKLTFIKGDSLTVLRTITQSFDLFHIDGNHVEEHIKEEWLLCVQHFMKKNTAIIFDDYDCGPTLENMIYNFAKMSFPHFKASGFYLPTCAYRNAIVEYSYYL